MQFQKGEANRMREFLRRKHFKGKGNCVLALFSEIVEVRLGLRRALRGKATHDSGSRTLMPEQKYTIETEQEDDGRWIAEIIDLPGVLAYGDSKQEAMANAEALALRVIADRIEETKIATARVSFGSL